MPNYFPKNLEIMLHAATNDGYIALRLQRCSLYFPVLWVG